MQATQSFHVFSLPQDLLDSLTPRNLVNKPRTRTPSPEPPFAVAASGQRACNICLGTTFTDVDEQRNHFKSDWHRYNVKMRMGGGSAVTESVFGQLVEGLDDSLSGSASSSDDDDSDDAVNALVKRTGRLNTRSPSPESSARSPLVPIIWFHSPPATQIGVYRTIFPLQTETKQYARELSDLQTPRPGGRTWAMFMVAGGHFAGAVVRVSRDAGEEDEQPAGKSKKQKKPKPDTEVLLHKTFHRYTTRRKQGGSQSLNDNAKGPAKSAGAQLRRYGEQALRDDIRNLLSDWADDIHDCERIWIRASTSNRKIFLDYDDAVIQKGDERLRTFPFPTRRPTQSEITRCLAELTRVKVSRFTEDQLREQDEAYLASLPKLKPMPAPAAPPPARERPQAPKLSHEEEALREKWARLVEMVSKGRVDALKVFWDRESPSFGGIDAPIPDWAGQKVLTLLQLAARSGQTDAVRWLLEEARADPTITVGLGVNGEVDGGGSEGEADGAESSKAKGSSRTAYDLAKSKGVRDVFRRCAALHLDWWDWLGAGHVPSVLSQDMEDEQEQKKKVRKKGLKDKLKERELKEKAREKEQAQSVEPAAKPKPAGNDAPDIGPRRLGGSSGSAEAVAGLTPEMRMRLERERRARAAEARLKALAPQPPFTPLSDPSSSLTYNELRYTLLSGFRLAGQHDTHHGAVAGALLRAFLHLLVLQGDLHLASAGTTLAALRVLMVATSTAIIGPSAPLLDLAKDALQPTGYSCEWQDRANRCGIILGSWNAYKKTHFVAGISAGGVDAGFGYGWTIELSRSCLVRSQHLRVIHCKPLRSQSWLECKLQKCNVRNHRSQQELEAHIDNSHLFRIPIVCPIAQCSNQRALKFCDLPQHFRDHHPDACTKVPPSHLHVTQQLRPFKPRPKDPPPPLPTTHVMGLAPVRRGAVKQGPWPYSDMSPSQKRRIPRNPRQVPSSKLKAKLSLKSGADSEDDEDFDLDMEDLVYPPVSPEYLARSIIVAKPGAKMDMDLSRPGPMLDPRLYGLRETPISIYFPYFKSFIEEEERKIDAKEKEEKEAEERKVQVQVQAPELEVRMDITPLQAPPLPFRKPS